VTFAGMSYFLRDTRKLETKLYSVANQNRIKRIEARLDGILSEVRVATSSASITEGDREALIDGIIEEAKSGFFGQIDSEISSRYGHTYQQKRQRAAIRSRSMEALRRLRFEVQEQKRRGNLNLILGTIAMVLGFASLFYLVIASGHDGDQGQAWVMFLRFSQRLSIVVVVELFAYFFLNLYRAGLAEIRYYQNEITNLELRLLALECAACMENSKVLEEILPTLTKTERNHLLKKGETTADLERNKLDTKQAEDTIRALCELLPKISHSNREQ
jgi:hypothetical protein